MSHRYVNRDHDVDLVNSWTQNRYDRGLASNPIWEPLWSPKSSSTKVRNFDEFSSSSNGRHWARNRGSLRDIGGDFTSRKSYLDSAGIPAGVRWKNRSYRCMTQHASFVQPTQMRRDARVVEWDDILYLGPLGAKAIDACRPGKPESDMLLSLVELAREGLPKAIGTQTIRDPSLKGASGDWLNYQFGIAPLISDFKSLVNTARNQGEKIDKINSLSGKPVRRRYEFEPERDSTREKLTVKDVFPWWLASTYSIAPGLRPAGFRVDSTSRRVWFSGSFTSYVALPREDRMWAERTAEIANRLYGVRVGPELIWNLTPWTWAADWVTNAGSVVANAEAFLSGDVVMHRGYIMAETKVTRHWHVSVPAYNMTQWSSSLNSHCWDGFKSSQEWQYISKVRRRANPYTVGFTGEGLDPKQVSILVALGISRG